jgi:acetyltransferase-like isoleucine patch superfamily enzyme
VLHVGICRSLYFTIRSGGGLVVVLRGTRLRLGRGARIRVARGCRLLIGKSHVVGTPSSVDIGRNARLTVHGRGRVSVGRGVRIFVGDGAHLEIGHETSISYDTVVTCYRHISMGPYCTISWNVNILDGNAHELIVGGVPRPRYKSVRIGTNVWIGTGVTILAAAVGDDSVVGAGSVVVSDVPNQVVVAGNPARVIRKDISWVI